MNDEYNVSIILFPDFETLDAFGPIEILGKHPSLHVTCYSQNGGLIYSAQSIATYTLSFDAIPDNSIILIPGGKGTRSLVNDLDFLRALDNLCHNADYCLTVCTGSALLARTPHLNGRFATSNKKSFAWVRSQNESVQWQSSARWTVDGKYYTSSGVSAGIDMALGFISDKFGRKDAEYIAHHIEYHWNDNPYMDAFAFKEND